MPAGLVIASVAARSSGAADSEFTVGEVVFR